MDFVSFLIESLDDKCTGNIKEIILFGSVARGTADKKSDIDLFVNVLKQDSITERKIEWVVNEFYKSSAAKNWKLKGIENEIKVLVDRLDKWKDLKVSIVSDGINLYSKYKAQTKGSQQIIIYWDTVRPESKRVLLSKKMYGYTYKKFKYEGLVKLTQATKLGSGCIIVGLENSKPILNMFREMGITAKTIYLSSIW